MSYNITSTITLRSTLTITPANAEALRRKRVLPECHFLDRQVVRMPELKCTNGHEATGRFCSTCGAPVEGVDDGLPISTFWWDGMGSGSMGNLAVAASYTKGEAEVVMVWEGGDSISAIKIKDGVVTEHEVEYTLGAAGNVIEPKAET